MGMREERLVTIDGLPEALRPHLGLLALPRDEVTKRYDRRLAKYFASYGHPETFLKHQAESFRDADMRDATVLDFGCGFGLIASMFAALGARRVVGIDMDPTMITRGRQLLQEWLPQDVRDRVELRCGDLLASDLTDEGFEVITTIESLSHVQSVSQAIGAIRRWIRPEAESWYPTATIGFTCRASAGGEKSGTRGKRRSPPPSVVRPSPPPSATGPRRRSSDGCKRRSDCRPKTASPPSVSKSTRAFPRCRPPTDGWSIHRPVITKSESSTRSRSWLSLRKLALRGAFYCRTPIIPTGAGIRQRWLRKD